VTPFSRNVARSLLKEPKLYFFDTGLVKGAQGIILENLIAGYLLKHAFAKRDYEGENYSLHYLQTKDEKEVDFALAQEENIKQIIEVKHSDTSLHSGLCYFHEKYGYPAVQVVKELKKQYQVNGIEIRQSIEFLKTLLL